MLTAVARQLRRVLTLAVTVGALLSAGSTFAQALPVASPAPAPSPAPQVVTFGVQPSTATNRDQRPFFSYDVTPGARLTDHVALLNFSLKPITVALYSTDAFNGADGSFSLLSGATKPTQAGSWLSLATQQHGVTIPPRASLQSGPGQLIVPFDVVVPANASPGDHAAGILAVLSTATKNAKNDNVKLDQRVGSRVYFRVSGPINARLSVESLKVTYHGRINPVGSGSATVSFLVENTGNVKLGARLAVTVSGWFGLTAQAPNLADLPLIFPGGSVRVTTNVPGVWPTIRITGKVSVLPLRLEGDDDGPIPVHVTSASTWAVPWVLLIIVILLLGLLAYYVRRRRRTPPTASAVPATSVEEAKKRSVAKAGVVTMSALGLVLAGGGIAFASTSLPYNDPGVKGQLTLCNAAGQAITTGSTHGAGWVSSVHSSLAVTSPYNAPGAKATLYAFQPRPGVDPGDWNGMALTGATLYDDPAHPAVVTSGPDYGLDVMVTDYPPMQDNLLQLRMYLSAPDEGDDESTYAAVDVQISNGGNTWTAVDAGSLPCSAGSGTPLAKELPIHPASETSAAPGVVPSHLLATATTAPPPDTEDPAVGASVPTASAVEPSPGVAGAAGSSSPAAGSPAAGSSGVTAPALATARTAGSGVSAGLIATVVILIVLAFCGGVGLTQFLRRRSSSS